MNLQFNNKLMSTELHTLYQTRHRMNFFYKQKFYLVLHDFAYSEYE